MPVELRNRTYFAYLDVPKDVRKGIGRRVFRQTLQTDSKSVAERRAAPLIAQWKAEIARAREEPNHNDARFWRDALRRAKTPEDRFIVETNMETHVFMQGLDNTDPEAKRFYGEAFGTLVPTTEHLEEWMSSLQVKDKTAKMRRATIGQLASKFPMLQDISRKEIIGARKKGLQIKAHGLGGRVSHKHLISFKSIDLIFARGKISHANVVAIGPDAKFRVVVARGIEFIKKVGAGWVGSLRNRDALFLCKNVLAHQPAVCQRVVQHRRVAVVIKFTRAAKAYPEVTI